MILFYDLNYFRYVNYEKTRLQSLKAFMKSHDEETRDLAVRERVFLNLLEAVNRVHDLGVPHLSINPETIWVENNSEVLLFPFRVPYEEETEAYPMWYLAPEYLFNSPEYYFNHE